MSRVRVTYSIKNTEDKSLYSQTGLYVLSERSRTFDSFEEAIDCIKKIRTMKDLVGSPLVESI